MKRDGHVDGAEQVPLARDDRVVGADGTGSAKEDDCALFKGEKVSSGLGGQQT